MQTKNDQSNLNRTELTAVRFSKKEMKRLRDEAHKQEIRPAVLLRNLFLESYPDHENSETSVNNSK